jgi:hypothetical protein
MQPVKAVQLIYNCYVLLTENGFVQMEVWTCIICDSGSRETLQSVVRSHFMASKLAWNQCMANNWPFSFMDHLTLKGILIWFLTVFSWVTDELGLYNYFKQDCAKARRADNSINAGSIMMNAFGQPVHHTSPTVCLILIEVKFSRYTPWMTLGGEKV